MRCATCSGGVIVLLQCVMCYTFWACYCSITVCDVLHFLGVLLLYHSVRCATRSGGVIVLLQCVMCYTFWACYCYITV